MSDIGDENRLRLKLVQRPRDLLPEDVSRKGARPDDNHLGAMLARGRRKNIGINYLGIYVDADAAYPVVHPGRVNIGPVAKVPSRGRLEREHRVAWLQEPRKTAKFAREPDTGCTLTCRSRG